MSQERFGRQIQLATSWRKRFTRTKQRDYFLHLAWSRHCVESAEFSEVAENRDVDQVLLAHRPAAPATLP